MRILRVAGYFAPAWGFGGPARSVFEACKGLVAQGETVRVLTTAANVDGELDVPLGKPVDMEGVETFYYPRQFPKKYFNSPELRKAIYEQAPQFDILHSHTAFISLGVHVRKAALQAGKPYVATYHGTLDPVVLKSKRLKKQIYWNLAESKNIAEAAAVIALTEEEKRQIHLLAPNAPVAVVPNGLAPINLEAIPPREFLKQIHPSLPDHPYALFLSRVNWKKGLDMLVPAWGALAKKYPDWKLVIAGPNEGGYQSTVEGLIKQAGIEDRVIFAGLVSGERKYALFRHSEFFTLPSYSEGLPTAVIEALMCGKPVVITDKCYMPEVQENGLGWVTATETGSVEQGLNAAMQSAEEREKRGAHTREFAIQNYSLDAVAKRTIELYKRAIASPKRADLTGL